MRLRPRGLLRPGAAPDLHPAMVLPGLQAGGLLFEEGVVIRNADDLLTELRRGRSVARLDGIDGTRRTPKLRWAVVETGETVLAKAVRVATPRLSIIQRDLIGEPMQYGAPD